MQNVAPRRLHFAFRIRHAAATLALVFLAAHLPFPPASLEDLDSINFALGLRHFDVARHQPHPPGYPVYIAIGKVVRAVVSTEVKALSIVSGVAGALGVFALFALFCEIDPGWPRLWSITAAFVTITSPLYWFTAARPLTDIPGLAASVAVQAFTLSATDQPRLIAASVLAGVATGLRSQDAWLTLPLIAFVVLHHPAASRARLCAGTLAGFLAGCALWAVPLVVLNGGPAAYWRALFNQGAEDLSGVQMLLTTPTVGQLGLALYYAFVAPWAVWQIAAAMLVLAVGGVVLIYRNAPGSPRRIAGPLAILAVAFVPYLVFDVLFQETITTRYALPLVAPVVYLAVRAAASLPWNVGISVAFGAGLVNAVIAGFSVVGYSLAQAPAFRMLDDMRAAAAVKRTPPLPPVFAAHRREDLDLRKPIQWVGPDMPAFDRRLPAPPRYEWLELVKYWNQGGRDPVWFVADPKRSDLALIDQRSGRRRSYGWPLSYPILLGGARPGEMDWYVVHPPGWYLGEGWSLTPETAGVSTKDRRDPAVTPIEGWIRRRDDPVTIMYGGRNLARDGSSVRVTVAIDDRSIDERVVRPGFFLHMAPLPRGALNGAGDYSRLSVSADRPGVAIEQFDAQPVPHVVFGFAEGWHEREYNPSTGRMWRWMSERGVIRAHGDGRALTLSLTGEAGPFASPSRVTARSGDRVLARWTVALEFSVSARIPADALTGAEREIIVETDQSFVPAERSWRTRDRRRLGLRIYDCQLTPVSWPDR
jgi:hypothetical protein